MSREEIADIKKKVQIYLNVGRYDASEKLLHLALDEFGKASNLHNLLGVTFHRQSKFKESLEQFELALIQNPKFTEAILNMAITLSDLGLYEDAEHYFKKAEETVSSEYGVPTLVLGRLANHHADAGRLYESCGMSQQALKEYQKALQLFPDMADVRLRMIQLLIDTKDLEKAQIELENLQRSERNMANPLIWTGIIKFITGQKDQAQDLWLKAREMKPNDPVARAFSSLASYIGRSKPAERNLT